MRRRRFPRRPLRRPIRGIPQRRSIPPKLKEAHRLFEAGEFEKAAKLFEDLAEKAKSRKIPQAPNLYMRSAAAWLKAGKFAEAEAMLKNGLGLFIEHQRWGQLNKSTSFTVEKLKKEGHADLAQKIQDWVDGQIPSDINLDDFRQENKFEGNAKQVRLPSNCHNCGGPVNPKEIEWFDAANPICSFCGSVLNNG